ncbi:hypothetical protein ACQ4N7_16925 [Nodosilinea sp. AN01ver1]|uniref:hypothetical protein n=1 Tax=Nodosilinea sp. AN01ver1 TaxID=3423362 RepID=UPI003D313D4E
MASQHRRAVGVFPDRPRTASALQALNDSGFSMSHVSVIAKDPERQTAIAGVKVKDEAGNQADTGGAVGAVTGGLLGGVTGLLVGLGTLAIPGIGPAVLAGEAATVLATLVGGAAGAAAGGLVGALIGMGIPEHRAKHYRDRVAQGDYLVMLKDTEPEIARAERTLKAAGIQDWGVYQVPDSVASAGSPNATFSGDSSLSGGGLAGNGHVSAGRDNPYNQVDHPMDQRYPHRETRREGTVPPATGLPHASNPSRVPLKPPLKP